MGRQRRFAAGGFWLDRAGLGSKFRREGRKPAGSRTMTSRPSSVKLAEQMKAILEEEGIAHVEDPAMPGFVIPWERGEDRISLYAEIPFDGGLVVRVHVPVKLPEETLLAGLAFCNEVNRRIPFGTAQLCGDRGQVQVRLGRTIFGRLSAAEATTQIGMVRDFAFSLIGPLQLIAAGECGLAPVLEVWEEGIRESAEDGDQEEVADPAG